MEKNGEDIPQLRLIGDLQFQTRNKSESKAPMPGFSDAGSEVTFLGTVSQFFQDVFDGYLE